MNSSVELVNVMHYSADVEIPLPIPNKVALESGLRSDMPVAMISQDGHTIIKRPTDTHDAAADEYRRIYNLPPVTEHNASRIHGRLARNIEVGYQLYGRIPLPATAVKNAHGGAAAVFGVQMSALDGDDGRTKVTVQGTSPGDGNREFCRTRQIIRERLPAEENDETNNNDMVMPRFPVRHRDGDASNKKGGRRGGK